MLVKGTKGIYSWRRLMQINCFDVFFYLALNHPFGFWPHAMLNEVKNILIHRSTGVWPYCADLKVAVQQGKHSLGLCSWILCYRLSLIVRWWEEIERHPDVHGANMGPTWVLSVPDGPHVGPMHVIKWKHFPRYWPFVRGIHRSLVNSPHKGQRRGALIFSLICA